MSDPEVVARTNACFDELWAEANAALTQIPWPIHDRAAAYLTRTNVLGLATRIVAAQERAVGRLSKEQP